ncbi:MAG: SAM-dependent methyltransferase, partial [Chloroflexi bacterium]|nr:SAM-dependent methyltransferase [Chloroflexota bacterium]
MALDVVQTRECLRAFDLERLFIEQLGWDHHSARLPVTVDELEFELSAIAQKRGMVAFACRTSEGRVPDYPTRRKIERRVAKTVHEHLVVYADSDKTTQVWQWVKRETGKPTVCREHTYYCRQPGDALIQKLQSIAFSLDEEELLTLPDVTSRTRVAFDVERVTKRFYDLFKSEHAAFLKFLKGIPDEDMQRWYVSVMINRLMFIYFIQKKDFLDDNMDYLRDKLVESRRGGKDRFYADFLCPLFFDGFAKRENERSPAVRQLLGKIPYLNGGIFQRHQLEELHGQTISIPDAAFEKLFTFFDQYYWHLDERPLRADNEINPDVLGYIFEKYINQKQMGAYYTKEDITGYISQNTVIPRLFDMARQKCRIAFEGERSIWNLLQEDPDRYIYEAVKKGVGLPLPEDIAVGVSDVAKRTEWNRAAPAEYALPTEIWREVVARRERYEEVWTKLVGGEVSDINDLITYNLDIRQFAQDVVETSDGPELPRAFWQALNKLTVLDPACGSGAFLFAALNILEPLYEACLNRMQVFLDELERSGEKHRPEKFSDFRKALADVEEHPNLRYFILKSIVLNNLYGVDLMPEAVEICKLRLFLKLVAQVEQADNIEPLPDIDFNIRVGNTLVGFTSRE